MTGKKREVKKREMMRSHNAELDLWMSSLTNAQIVYKPIHILNYGNIPSVK
jgi:hypothetical protein